MNRILRAAGAALLLFGAAESAAAEADLVERGRYLFAAAGGCGCHTADLKQPNAGGRESLTPFGTFYGTNITPDREHGIGAWSDDEIAAAIRRGLRPDGSALSPVMPYPAYAGIADEDIRAIVAFLRTQPASAKPNRAHDTTLPFSGLAARAWRWWYFDAPPAPAKAPTSGLARGRYLVDHLSHCRECHTPRAASGALDLSMYLAGAIVDEQVAQNITPHPETGIGRWSKQEIADLVKTGFLPDMDNVQGLMGLLIDGLPWGYRHLRDDDALAIAEWLQSVPPIDHRVRKPKGDDS